MALLADCVAAYMSNEDGIREKQKYPRGYKNEIIRCAALLGELCERSDEQRAEAAFRSMWHIYFDSYERPNESDLKEKLLLYPRGLIGRGQLAEAVPLLEEYRAKLIHGLTELRWLGQAWTCYGEASGDFSTSIQVFDEYNSARHGIEFLSLEDFEKQRISYPDGPEYENATAAAGMIVTYHHSAISDVHKFSRQSLQALDSILRDDAASQEYQISSYKLQFLNQHLVPELGAYFGEVLCNELDGRWEPREPLMLSRIRLGHETLAPFESAYRVAFYGRRLASEFDRLAQK